MAKYTFKIETEDLEELELYQNAHRNSYIVFDIAHHFHRKFEHLDGKHEEFYQGVSHVLDELNKLVREEN